MIRTSIQEGSPLAKAQCKCILSGRFSPAQRKQLEGWSDRLAETLKPGRFAHSLSVADTAVRLSEIHGFDVLRAAQAGLLHDCAKGLSPKEMRRIAEENRLTDDSTVLADPGLLHSVVGAWIAEKSFGMEDPAVLQAIRYHTTGSPGMAPLDMCVCLSDSIEPLRGDYPMLDEIRALAELSVPRALLLSLETTAEYVASRGRFLHPRTRDTILWLREQPECRDCR